MPTTPISDNTPRNQYTATASQTIFPYTFWVNQEEDIDVYVGTTLKTLTTDYTVSAVQVDAGGNIVFGSGLAGGEVVTIARNTEKERQTGFSPSGDFQEAALDLQFTLFIAILQELQLDIDRSVSFSATSTAPSSASTLPDPDATKYLGWNAAGTALENKDALSGGTVTIPTLTGHAFELMRVASGAAALEFATLGEVVDELATLSGDSVDKDNDLVLVYDATSGDVASMSYQEFGKRIITDATSGSTVVSGDSVIYSDASDSNRTKRISISSFLSQLGISTIFTESFTSAEQTITSAGSLTIAHGLSGQPKLITAFLRCKTANLNYSVDDEVQINIHYNERNAAGAQGISVVADATNLNIRFGDQANVFALINKTTGASADITTTSWRLLLNAYY